MANADRPTGFSPVSIFGVPYAGQGNIYSIAASYGSAVAIGDPVFSSGTASADGYAGVVLATDDGNIRGVVVGLGRSPTVLANWANLDSTVRPASDPNVWYALVADDPNTVFQVQSAGAIAATDVGLNANVSAGANNGFVSGYELGAPIAAGAAGQARILGKVNIMNNDFGTNAKVLVKFVEHELSSTSGV